MSKQMKNYLALALDNVSEKNQIENLMNSLSEYILISFRVDCFIILPSKNFTALSDNFVMFFHSGIVYLFFF